jgi:hypothetical protein
LYSPKLEFIGSSYAEDDEIAIPAHQAGDLLVILAMETYYDLITPSGWTQVSGSNVSRGAGYRVATAADTLSGDWGYPTTTHLASFVWRGSTGVTSVGANKLRIDSNTMLSIPDLTCQFYNSWIISMAFSLNQEFILLGAPTDLPGMTLRFNNARARRAWDSDGPKVSLPLQTIYTTTDHYLSLSMEVKQ